MHCLKSLAPQQLAPTATRCLRRFIAEARQAINEKRCVPGELPGAAQKPKGWAGTAWHGGWRSVFWRGGRCATLFHTLPHCPHCRPINTDGLNPRTKVGCRELGGGPAVDLLAGRLQCLTASAPTPPPHTPRLCCLRCSCATAPAALWAATARHPRPRATTPRGRRRWTAASSSRADLPASPARRVLKTGRPACRTAVVAEQRRRASHSASQ